MKAEQLINNFFAFAFLILGIACFMGAIFYAAYWHYFTAIVCIGMSILLFKTKY